MPALFCFPKKEMEAKAMTDETTPQQGDQTSAGDSGTTSEEKPTLTITQARAMSAKDRSDALAELGRIKKAAEDNGRIAQDALRRLQEYEEGALRREEEAAKDDPDKLSAIRERRTSARRVAEAEAKERQVAARESEFQAQLQELLSIRAERLSEKYNASQDVLLKYGGGTKESMEELAKTFGERKTAPGETKTRVTSPPDSGKNTGGGKQLTKEDVAKMSPEERNRRNPEIAALPFM